MQSKRCCEENQDMNSRQCIENKEKCRLLRFAEDKRVAKREARDGVRNETSEEVCPSELLGTRVWKCIIFCEKFKIWMPV